MSNPWLKKNPFMSMWMSAANRVAGTLRGQATVQVKRQVNAALKKATNDNLKVTLDAIAPASPKAKAKPKRRR